MKRFLSLKRALQVISVTALAVLFLVFINALVSNRSIIENLFSTKKIFVGTFDVGNKDTDMAQEKAVNKNYSVSLSTKTNSKKKVSAKSSPKVTGVVSSAKAPSSSTMMSSPPKLYIQEIQVGDEISTLNEFVKICNYGDPAPLKDLALKKKSSTGNEEGLLGSQWGNIVIIAENCIYAANADAIFSFDVGVRWAKSHTLAEKSNTLSLYYKSVLIDEVFWNVIPKGKSIVRDSATSTWYIKG